MRTLIAKLSVVRSISLHHVHHVDSKGEIETEHIVMMLGYGSMVVLHETPALMFASYAFVAVVHYRQTRKSTGK
jgi:hypothetical protein